MIARRDGCESIGHSEITNVHLGDSGLEALCYHIIRTVVFTHIFAADDLEYFNVAMMGKNFVAFILW